MKCKCMQIQTSSRMHASGRNARKNPSVALDVRDDRNDGAGKSENTVDGFALWLRRVSPRATQPTLNYSPALQPKRTGAGFRLRAENKRSGQEVQRFTSC